MAGGAAASAKGAGVKRMGTAMDEESRLVEEAREGSEEAFTTIIRLHQARIRTFLHGFVRSRDLVDDLAQETFLTAYRRLSTFAGEAPLHSWLLSLARNHALMHLRAEGRRRQREERKMASLLAEGLANELEAASSRTERMEAEAKALEDCVRRLPPTSARLISDYYFKGRAAVDVARELGKNAGTIWSLLLRVRHSLRSCIEERLRPGEAAP
jgi:RNA polymerase sigma-70 factor (ECF subfamily)